MAHLQFSCPFCKDEFISPEQLRQHRLVTHKNEVNEVQPPPRKLRRKHFDQAVADSDF